MTESGGVYTIPCKVNGLDWDLIFDTGASKVCISLTEALYMLKHGQLKVEDVQSKEYYSIADGSISEGTKVILRKLEIAGIVLKDIEASVIHKLNAPLLFGQSGMAKLGKFQIDAENKTLTILNGPASNNYSPSNQTHSSPSQTYSPPKDAPCIEVNGEIKYVTEIIESTVLRTNSGNFGEKIKFLPIGFPIRIINDKDHGDYALAKYGQCGGYVLKIALKKFKR